MTIDVSPALDKIAYPITLKRYEYYFDQNGQRHLEDDPSATYEILGSIQEVDSSLAWEEEGVNTEETRRFFSYYPVRDKDNNELDITLRAKEDRLEEEQNNPAPVDTIEYHGQRFDITGSFADYREYGYRGFILTRVSGTI